MKAVWQRSPITVKDVQGAIQQYRPLAYTTVLTIMHRLYLKGFLQRSLQSRTHYYEPAVDYVEVRDAAVDGVIDHFFQGSRDKFLQFLDRGPAGPPQTVHEISAPAAFDETLL